MANRLRKLKLNEISLVGDGANPGARVVLFKSENEFKPCDECKDPKSCAVEKGCAVKKTGTVVSPLATDASGNSSEDIQKEQDMTEKDKAPAATTPEDIQKMVSESVTKALAEQKTQHAEVVKALTGQIEDLQKANQEVVLVAKTKAITDRIAGLDPELVKKGIAKANADTEALIEKMASLVEGALKTAKAFTDVGHAAQPGTVLKAGEALAQLNAKAEEIRKGDSKLSIHQAFAKAAAAEPKLYEAYLASQN